MDFKFKESNIKKIIYKFADGTQKEVEVTDEFYAQYQKIEKDEKNKNRAETRRHISLSQIQENGFEPIFQELSPEEILNKKETKKEVLKAISLLKPKEQELVFMYFYDNKTIEQIAEILNVQKPAISKHLSRILEKLKKIL